MLLLLLLLLLSKVVRPCCAGAADAVAGAAATPGLCGRLGSARRKHLAAAAAVVHPLPAGSQRAAAVCLKRGMR